MITKKAKYALKALAHLAQRCSSEPVLISEIAAKEKIPQKFLEAILLELKNKGILDSKKGKRGGYFFARSPDQVKLSEVLRAIEGPIAPLPCLSKTAHVTCDDCANESTCGIKKIMHEAYEAQLQHLEKKTLGDLADFCNQVNAAPSYSI